MGEGACVDKLCFGVITQKRGEHKKMPSCCPPAQEKALVAIIPSKNALHLSIDFFQRRMWSGTMEAMLIQS